MPGTHPVDALAEAAHRFGPGAAAAKLALLRGLEGMRGRSIRRLRRLHDTLCFLRAYPDSKEVLDAVLLRIADLRNLVEARAAGDPLDPAVVNSGLPGTTNSYAYSHAVLERLVELDPGRLEIDWGEVEDEFPLSSLLGLLAAPAEARGLEDESLATMDWLRERAASTGRTQLETVLDLCRASGLDRGQQMHLYESCDPPVLYPLAAAGTAASEAVRTPERVHYQKAPVARDRFPLPPWIRKPPGSVRRLSAAAGRRMLDLSLRSLCARNLEIYSLIYGNPADVTLVRYAAGIEVLLAGVLPAFRTVPESLYFFLILKNGVPVAYGPASIFLGRCEMGINLFPEYRGGEIHRIYAEFMRTLHHLGRARYFYVTPYGMGVDNEDAIESGAFWFYRKMGFRPTNPAVEALAREEEAVMRRRPGHRSDRRMLRRLSHTHVYLSLEEGLDRIDLALLSREASRRIGRRRGGHPRRAGRAMARDLLGTLGIGDGGTWSGEEKRALEHLAPFLLLVDDLGTWPSAERRRLAAAVRARGKAHEYDYLRRLDRLPRLETALLSLLDRLDPVSAGVPRSP